MELVTMQGVLVAVTTKQDVYVALDLCGAILTAIAVRNVVKKAGYSLWWLLIPLTTLGLWAALLMMTVFDAPKVTFDGVVITIEVPIEYFRTWFHIFEASLFITWFSFLIFAALEWPVGTTNRPAKEAEPNRTAPVIPVRPGGPMRVAPPLPPPRPPSPSSKGRPSEAARAVATDSSATPAPQVVYCPWCGKSRAVDAHAIHHCGPLDRPPAYCKVCGTPLAEGSMSCASCAPPVERVPAPD
jgi:hypothetical protein